MKTREKMMRTCRRKIQELREDPLWLVILLLVTLMFLSFGSVLFEESVTMEDHYDRVRRCNDMKIDRLFAVDCTRSKQAVAKGVLIMSVSRVSSGVILWVVDMFTSWLMILIFVLCILMITYVISNRFMDLRSHSKASAHHHYYGHAENTPYRLKPHAFDSVISMPQDASRDMVRYEGY